MTFLAGLLLAGALASAPVPQAAEPPAVQQRRAAFERCRAILLAVEPLLDAAAPPSPADLKARLQAPLREAAALESLRLEDRPLALPWVERFSGELGDAADPAAAAELTGRLYERLFETCRRLGLGDFPETQPDRGRLLAILSRPEYDLRAREDSVLFRVLESLRTWLRDVFALSSGVETVALSFRAVFLVVACLLAGWLALRVARGAHRRRRLREAGAGEAGPPVLDSPQRYRQEADRALATAQGREAIRLALLFLLSTLERLRLASPGRTATNREVAEQLADRGGSPQLTRETLAAVEWYDRAWYGLAPVGLEQARGFYGTIQAICERAAAEARSRQEGA